MVKFCKQLKKENRTEQKENNWRCGYNTSEFTVVNIRTSENAILQPIPFDHETTCARNARWAIQN